MGENRRTKVLNIIKTSLNPISASSLAQSLGVSRQVIVGDVALLRASGESIVATSKGYVYNPYSNGKQYMVAVNHDPERTHEELSLFVDLDVVVVNVMVEHPLYGELVGNLNIKTYQDIEDYFKVNAQPLSVLTNGIHLHTIQCRDDEHYKHVVEALKERKLLLEN